MKTRVLAVMISAIVVALSSSVVWSLEKKPRLAKPALSGTVTDHNQQPLANAKVTVKMGSENSSRTLETKTNDKGRYTFAYVLPGNISVTVTAPGSRSQTNAGAGVAFSLKSGENRTMDFTLPSVVNPDPEPLRIKTGTYLMEWNPNIDCTDSTRAICFEWGDAAVARIKNVPKLVSEKPYYWVFRIDSRGDGLIGVVLDESKGTGRGYDKAYIDANRDWDLSNDAPIMLDPLRSGAIFSEWVEVESAQGKPGSIQTHNPLQVRLAPYLSGEDVYCTVRLKGAWKGSVGSNLGPIDFALIDSNCNGIYGEEMQRDPGYPRQYTGDSVCIDSEKNGAWQEPCYGIQTMPIARKVEVQGQSYRIIPTRPGNVVTIVRGAQQ